MPVTPVMAGLKSNINPYSDKNPMPMLDGIPIGAYGAQWSGTTNFDPSTNPRAQKWLEWMQQSDPSAHWQNAEVGGQNVWQFTQDHPGAEGVYPELQQQLQRYGGGQTMENVYENGDWQSTGAKPHGYAGQVINQNAMINTPFGRITPTANTRTPTDLISRLGPMSIGLMAAIMSGGAASPLLGMLTKAPQMLDSLGHGGNLMGMLPGILASYGRSFLGGP